MAIVGGHNTKWQIFGRLDVHISEKSCSPCRKAFVEIVLELSAFAFPMIVFYWVMFAIDCSKDVSLIEAGIVNKDRDGKPSTHPDKSSRIVPMSVLLVVLCGFSFYLGGIFCSENSRFGESDVKDVSKSGSVSGPLQTKSVVFPQCSADYQDYTPCTDPRRWRKYGLHRLTFMERHCPPAFERKECLVPPPNGYKPPIKWPKCRDECWYRNVPYDWINKQKSNQHWLRKEGEKFLFPGGGTMFPDGVSAYVDLMRDLIPEMQDGTVRTAIDTGCGVASWGGDLLDRGILTVSLAPRDNHEAQIQFALERGIPAILGIISTQRLPFPSNSFDMAHCSRCLIPWTEFGGIYLLEVHRILRPGGFWVLSGPPVNYERRWRGWNTTVEEQRTDYEKLQELLTSMCFKLYNKKEDIAVWQKSSDNGCYDEQLKDPDVYPPKCDDGTEPDAAWYTPLRPCVVVPNPKLKKLGLKSVPKWPERLHVAPERISDIHGGSASSFKHDDSKCEAFSTYPRTYDLLHVDGLFSAESQRCDMKYVLLEMDRILRPNGFAIIHESSYFIDAVATIAKGMRWSCRKEDTEYAVENEKILICQKKLWYSNQTSR
ncbi:putative S-adenosyl-L-methionine-dependent methyltransferase [Dillenia turbinata]|uniref:Methyltransferase n=1 Tax=Dillenia turbinata TaxID=194707 RepID=A0AAN8VGY2_9MAGN